MTPSGHFTRTFCAAHRVWNDPGKCRNIHGHNYTAEVDVQVDHLNEQNFVTPFDAIKKVIDAFDHTLILDESDPLADEFDSAPLAGLDVSYVAGVPSTEFMAKLIADRICAAISQAGHAKRIEVRVALRETAGIEATSRSQWSGTRGSGSPA